MRTLLWALRALPPPAVTLAAAAARAPATWFPLTCDRGVVRASRDRTVGWARLRSVREGDESAVVPAATAPRARVALPSEPRRVTYRYGAQLPARHAAAVCVRTSAAAVRAYALARRGAAWLLRWSCHALAAACACAVLLQLGARGGGGGGRAVGRATAAEEGGTAGGAAEVVRAEAGVRLLRRAGVLQRGAARRVRGLSPDERAAMVTAAGAMERWLRTSVVGKLA
jgi:hypothetical protein